MDVTREDLQEVLFYAPGNIYWTDCQGNYLGCNENQMRGFGCSSMAEVVGKNIFHFQAKEQAQLIFDVDQEVIRTGKEILVEEIGLDSEGREAVFLSRKIARHSGDTTKGLLGISINITDQKHAEALEKELLLSQLAETKSYAQGQADMARHLAYQAGSLAHELRTPVSTCYLQVQTTGKYMKELFGLWQECHTEGRPNLMEIPKRFHEPIQRFEATLANEFVKMNQSIDYSLLNIRAGISGALRPQDLQLCGADKNLNEILSRFPCSGNDRGKLHWDRKFDFKFLGNSLLFSQIIDNLVKNAFEQIAIKGKGEIFISSEAKGDTHHLIRVRDTAGGVTEEVIQSLFEGFRSTKVGGTGIGLTFCQSTMSAFGGSIEAHLVDGDCIEFVLSFPKISEG